MRWGKTLLTAALLLVAIVLPSCSAIYDDLEDCPPKVEMRFIFDYNLEMANSFHKNVDCLSVFLFDSEGNLVERRVENTEVLQDEDWRMYWDELPAGNYTAVAYGGMDCDKTSFNHVRGVENIKTISDLEVLVDETHLGDEQNAPTGPLHDHFHGACDFTVTKGISTDKVRVEMMRNTNHLRLVLQHIDNSPVDYQDFKFEVIDDNVRFAHNNDVLPHRTINYQPWSTGNAVAGTNGYTGEDGDETKADTGMPVQVAFAEISMSRLMYNSAYTWTRADGEVKKGPRLRITNVKDNHTVADLPLNQYLLLMKSDMLSSMDNQEYLDRSYRHNLVFFLDSDNTTWLGLNIIVGPWTVRIVNADF